MNDQGKMIHGEICRRPHDNNGYFGWPSVTRMDDGTLIAGASGFRYRHICPWGMTTIFFSHDDGQTWSEPMVIHDSPLDDRDVGVVALKNQIVMRPGSRSIRADTAIFLNGGAMKGSRTACAPV